MKNKDLLQQLIARLPELEWKISYFGPSLSTKTLPRGLFSSHLEMNAANCIAEIKADIQKLAGQKNENSAKYLAARIEQKISVLVTLCHLQMNKPKSKVEQKVKFSLNQISTRQLWLKDLEVEINRLTEQQNSLTKTLEELKIRGENQGVLQLQAELGELQKRLTMAKEAS